MGAQAGAEMGADMGAEAGAEMGADMGAEVGAVDDLAAGVDAEEPAGAVLGRARR
jgi:hypothetical protein